MDITTYKTYLSQRNLSGNTISSYIYDIEKFSSYLDDDYDLGLLETKKGAYTDISCDPAEGRQKLINNIKDHISIKEFFFISKK